MNENPSPEQLRDASAQPADQAAPKKRAKANSSKTKQAKRTCIMVLGMHRSGTSAVTRVLNLLGAVLPEQVIAPDENNANGYWEPTSLNTLNERMLAEAGSSWDDWRPYDVTRLSEERRKFYRSEIARIIGQEYGAAPLFVIKEPRISRFAGMYAEILQSLRIDVRYVLVSRNPLAVAASLERRGGSSRGFGTLVWLRHVLDAEQASRGKQRALVSYEAIVENWRPCLQKVTSTLSLDWPRSLDDARSDVDAFISSANQHHHAGQGELDASTTVAGWVKDSYAALQSLERDPYDQQASKTLDRVRHAFDAVSTTFGDAIYPDLHALNTALAAANNRIQSVTAESAAEIEASKQALEEQRIEFQSRENRLQDQLKKARTAASEQRKKEKSLVEMLEQEQAVSARAKAEQLAEIRDELTSIRRTLETTVVNNGALSIIQNERQQLEIALARSQTEVARYTNAIREMRNSTSWRVSSPIRAMKCLFTSPVGSARALLAVGRRAARRLPIPVHMKHSVKMRLLKYDVVRKAGSLSRREATGSVTSSSATIAAAPLAFGSSPSVEAEYIRQVLAIAKRPAGTDLDYVPRSEEVIDFARSPLKVMAFYLPQFHPIAENDEWWGKGFTEWTNVTKAVPQYIGHYQPHLPGELGFYDLRVADVMRQQAALAKSYGVAGFCFHHYWFGGKRLLEKPVRQFLENTEIDIDFCLCWANENWTRRWDGQEQDVLMAQQHSPSDDVAFLDDILPALQDRRYLRHEGRAVLIVYRASLLPDSAATAARWRERAKAAGVGDLYLVAAQTFGILDPRPLGFDAAIEFPPHMGMASGLNGQLKIVNPDFRGQIYGYEELAASYGQKKRPPYQLIKTVSPSWDNEARKPGSGHSFYGANPASYAKWLRSACDITIENLANDPTQPPVVFVNAWNEWAEGAHLEPDRKFGYGYLHATANVMRDFIAPDPRLVELVEQSQKAFRKRSRLAIVLHLHYDDLFEDILENLSNVSGADLFVTLRRDAPGTTAERVLGACPNARLWYFRNRGRDMQPFLQLLPLLVSEGYELACKVHSKKSPHRRDGDALRSSALSSLLGSRERVEQIVRRFEKDRKLGLLAPAGTLLDLGELDRNILNRSWLDRLFPRLGMQAQVGRYDTVFPAGSMFWFRPKALKPFADLSLGPDDFEEEVGQIDGTLAHAIERLTAAVALHEDYSVGETDSR
ncbi:glycoside hydrolase family 99-like domain-containing protein [Mesorhizobium sp. WSM3859]|uniref:glycoside hydrolase family 99-like domain-containing protein n=1 Tax=Mesorhizobium sp. WSM3859 TaxID=2029402 RepID=UPI0015971052|nr:glycoside hydrolase family 99-like domain-containing protein [Mesorhizobium sp. WSM3859]